MAALTTPKNPTHACPHTPVQLQLSCRAGHVLESARDVTPVPGPGARKIA
ncbi:MAG TPA: hypothetical protein VKG80_10755 [Trebonia sp.]|nr:hypothetical protein [Trebonia sp.]